MSPEQWVLCGLGTYLLSVAVLFAIYPPHSKEYMERGSDRILGTTQTRESDPCPTCMVPLDEHSHEQSMNCAKIYFR